MEKGNDVLKKAKSKSEQIEKKGDKVKAFISNGTLFYRIQNKKIPLPLRTF